MYTNWFGHRLINQQNLTVNNNHYYYTTTTNTIATANDLDEDVFASWIVSECNNN